LAGWIPFDQNAVGLCRVDQLAVFDLLFDGDVLF
jgi:hypothetical protein